MMSNSILNSINRMIKNSYLQTKKKQMTHTQLSKPLSTAWEFIDHLFILELEEDDKDYYDILVDLIPLLKPQTIEEKKEVFIKYLELIGITMKHKNFDMILNYYMADQPSYDLSYLNELKNTYSF